LSRIAAEVSIEACRKAKESGLTVSCDLNFRKKLWDYETALSKNELARKTMGEILPFVDVLIGNEEDAEDILGIKAGKSNAQSGKLEIHKYPEVAKEISQMFPNICKVAITLRESISATHNNWGAMLYDVKRGAAVFAPVDSEGEYKPYEIRNIVDRVGGGDSFSGSLIYALQDNQLRKCNSEVLSFAVAASCLCHSIEGDFNFVSKSEVESLALGDESGRVKR
jgi:2-dehydro-3-deoxygluconokinase